MSKVKKLVIVVFIVLCLLFIIHYFYSPKTLNIEQAINNINGIDKVDKNKEICVQSINNIKIDIDCFIPNKITDFQKQYNYSDSDIINFLSGASITNNKVLSFEEQPLFYQIFDRIHPNISNIENVSSSYKGIKKGLETLVSNNKGVLDNYLAYYYILNLEGKYQKAEVFRNKICSKFKYLCDKDLVYVVITGKILDENKKPLSGVKLQLAGGKKIIETNSLGEYYYSISVSPFTKIRLFASKNSYSVGIGDFDVITPVRKQNFTKDYVLNKSNNTININTFTNQISGKNSRIENNNFIIKTDWSEYKIPFDSIVSENGLIYKGKLKVYTWEFNKQSNLTSLINSDIFDEVAGYAGDLMKTFGMPFIMFIADNGEKLHVIKSNPITLITRIQEMNALKTNKDRIYSELTNKDLEFLIKKSKEFGGYPIDRIFLVNNDILRYPAFWVFDQYKGIWVNQGVRVLNTNGDAELKYFTLSEKK